MRAYEVRISDWSSDVCSSDLARTDHARWVAGAAGADGSPRTAPRGYRPDELGYDRIVAAGHRHPADSTGAAILASGAATDRGRPTAHRCRRRAVARSEEHTSELQSLMRIAYAAFCLKKNTNIITLQASLK